MKEIKYYIADDGTEFDSEDECLEYENRFSSVINKIIFIQDREILNPKESNIKHCCEWCTAIYIPHEEDIEAISQMFDSFGVENPFNNCYRSGIHYYEDGWISLDEEIEKLENRKEFLMSLIGME